MRALQWWEMAQENLKWGLMSVVATWVSEELDLKTIITGSQLILGHLCHLNSHLNN